MMQEFEYAIERTSLPFVSRRQGESAPESRVEAVSTADISKIGGIAIEQVVAIQTEGGYDVRRDVVDFESPLAHLPA